MEEPKTMKILQLITAILLMLIVLVLGAVMLANGYFSGEMGSIGRGERAIYISRRSWWILDEHACGYRVMVVHSWWVNTSYS
ncbi:hypothetical protein ACG1BZ_17365 [Microbulbifer sp. CNSA002]|uniref:hypothetical protein n=1 Tax=Microbulbifer sp. CNSA002 TaxID=3373604 RepID=UPI0039B514DD